MPELPEVETMRRGLLPVISSQIVAVETPPCDRRPILIEPPLHQIHERLRQHRILDIGRLGKRVLIHTDADATLVIEPRMTGLVLIADPPTREHLRLRLKLDGGPCNELLFWDRRGLGTVRLLDNAQLQSALKTRLGPDALQVDAEQLRERFKNCTRPIKPALLDQQLIAGIGNLYASEILFVAAIDPRARCHQLSKPQWHRIHQATVHVLEEAIRHEGSTLSDGTYRNALNDAGGYQNMHRVYDRAGKPCPRCETKAVRRIVQAQRSTFFCPSCQSRRGKPRANTATGRPNPDQFRSV